MLTKGKKVNSLIIKLLNENDSDKTDKTDKILSETNKAKNNIKCDNLWKTCLQDWKKPLLSLFAISFTRAAHVQAKHIPSYIIFLPMPRYIRTQASVLFLNPCPILNGESSGILNK